MKHLHIHDNSTIAILGGGPAGSLFALFALEWAKKFSKKITVIIFEQKKFTNKGPMGCNKCAGVIQSTLLYNLKKIGIEIGEECIQSKVDGYTFWVKGMAASIKQEPHSQIVTVFRGEGPPRVTIKKQSFDQYLLNKALEKGAIVIEKTITAVEWNKDSTMPVKILYEKDQSLQADLVVGAFGVNNPPIPGLPSTYTPPNTWQAFQTEIPITDLYMQEKYTKMINVYFIKPKGVKYLAATPKGNYLSISAIGQSVKTEDIKTAIAQSELKDCLPKDWKLECACYPHIPSSSAKGTVSDRFIVIGDAAYSRWLKNGIESAYYTAFFAAEAVFKKGISAPVLQKYYARRCWRIFEVDNIFGKILFHCHELIMKNRILSYSYLNLVKKEQYNQEIKGRRLSEVLWHLYTGNASYARILFKGINPFLQVRLVIETVILLCTKTGVEKR